MRATVVIRSKDEADRLRLTLASLAMQTEKPEVVVVNDGSSDHTVEVVAAAAKEMNVTAVDNAKSIGRSASSNAGASKAKGDILLFLDGDTLAAPDLVERHMDLHRANPNLIVRGETWHLRCTRLFLDPETGTPRRGEESKVARMSESEKARSLVTRDQVRNAFDAIASRGQPAIYPGFGPRKLYELEMGALRDDPEGTVLWAAASGSNQSLNRAAFLESGGFHPDITINEHRELALRLCKGGLRMTATNGRNYHMTHRSGWRDPLEDRHWESIFYNAHPIPEVALLPFLWGSLSDPLPFPPAACIRSLAELATVAERYRGIQGMDNVRDAHLRASISTTEAR